MVPGVRPRDQESRLQSWLAEVDAAGSGRVSRHPVFHHDDERRPTAQFYLAPDLVTGANLRELIRATLGNLARSCSEG